MHFLSFFISKGRAVLTRPGLWRYTQSSCVFSLNAQGQVSLTFQGVKYFPTTKALQHLTVFEDSQHHPLGPAHSVYKDVQKINVLNPNIPPVDGTY